MKNIVGLAMLARFVQVGPKPDDMKFFPILFHVPAAGTLVEYPTVAANDEPAPSPARA